MGSLSGSKNGPNVDDSPLVQESKMVKGREDLNDWCFVCKDGGRLLICDIPKCGKCYHYKCVGLRKAGLTSQDWQCPQHRCFNCHNIPVAASCYTCPNAICDVCFQKDSGIFIRMSVESGFCEKCMELLLYIEGQTKVKPKSVHNFKNEGRSWEHFVEFYGMVKEAYGFSFDEVLALKMGGNSVEKHKEISTDKNFLEESKDFLKDVTMVPSLVQDNVQRIFLTRSVIRKLLMEPDSFEAKVKNAFIGIELPKATPRSNIIHRELVQVTGIMKKEADNGQIEIELQAKDRPGIPIDKVSDFDFYESLCKHLEQQVKDGHIEMPNIEEFKWKARVLSEALVDDYIPREERKLQLQKKRAHDLGRKEEFFHYDCMLRKLLTSEERSRLITHFQEVCTEPIDSGTGLGDKVAMPPVSPLMAVGKEVTEGKGKEVVDVRMENLQAPSQRKRLGPSPSGPNKKAKEVSADHVGRGKGQLHEEEAKDDDGAITGSHVGSYHEFPEVFIS